MANKYIIVKSNGSGLEFTQLLGKDQSKEAYEAKAESMGAVVVEQDSIPTVNNLDDLALDGNKVVIDPQAKINRVISNVRRARDAKLQNLDVESMRAIEDGDTDKLQEVKEKKQQLRDLPAALSEKMDKITKAPRKRTQTKMKDIDKIKLPELED